MFFFNLKNDDKLGQVLSSWEGTPYRHWSGVKGQGTDCIFFVVGVLKEMGFKHKIKIQNYSSTWHLHNSAELLFEGVKKQISGIEGDLLYPQNGDIVLYRFGKTISHSGIYYNGYVFQAVNNVGVVKLSFQDKKWHKRMSYIYKVLEK